MKILILFLFLTIPFEGRAQSRVLSWQLDSLIMASDDEPVFYEFDLTNKDRDIYRFRQIYHGYNNTKAVTYDVSTNTLFWTGSVTNRGEQTDHILSTVNNSGVINTLFTSSSSVYGLAIDKGRQLLFFTTGWSHNSVGVMSTNGDGYRNLGNVRSKCFMSPFDLALDTEREMIYVACYYRLISMTYHGGNKQQMRSGSYIYGVHLDEDSGTLYYNNNKDLYTSNPSGSSTYERYYKYLPSPATNIKRYGNHLFVAYLETDEISVIDLKQQQTSTIHIPNDQYHRWTLAYVPCKFGNFGACNVYEFVQHLANRLNITI